MVYVWEELEVILRLLQHSMVFYIQQKVLVVMEQQIQVVVEGGLELMMLIKGQPHFIKAAVAAQASSSSGIEEYLHQLHLRRRVPTAARGRIR